MSGPPKNGASRPPLPHSGRSYQNQRPETEWNDLPDDMANRLLVPPPRGNPGESGSGASSRSSSTARKKRDRAYPAAAFGK
ncbi:Pre-mRNA-splicing factor [Fusarium albosuccineum]|uniref:Pre-mRNA-splicing factor n=1 Tax=Fusarium albosuccineum TaxID=1237068 RepID=A0A8H4K7G2_9HYPO|nr:Pre-mRNA-splicing factor [Fusarium albosuccineum]